MTLRFTLISIWQACQSEGESDLFTDEGSVQPRLVEGGLRAIGSAAGVAMLSSRVTVYLAYSAGVLGPIEMPEPSPGSAGPSRQLSVTGASQQKMPFCGTSANPACTPVAGPH